MPCTYDPDPEPTENSRHLQQTAKLILWVSHKLGIDIPPFVEKESHNKYAKDEKLVPHLCGILRALSKEAADALIYDARDANSRKLADWWEAHQEADKKREEAERKAAEKDELRKQALNKLSEAERKVLGL